jgi:hypothetical protein
MPVEVEASSPWRTTPLCLLPVVVVAHGPLHTPVQQMLPQAQTEITPPMPLETGTEAPTEVADKMPTVPMEAVGLPEMVQVLRAENHLLTVELAEKEPQLAMAKVDLAAVAEPAAGTITVAVEEEDTVVAVAPDKLTKQETLKPVAAAPIMQEAIKPTKQALEQVMVLLSFPHCQRVPGTMLGLSQLTRPASSAKGPMMLLLPFRILAAILYITYSSIGLLTAPTKHRCCIQEQ